MKLHVTLALKSPPAPTQDKSLSAMKRTHTDAFDSEMDQALHHRDQTTSKMNDIEANARLVDSLQQQQIGMCNEVERKLNLNNDEQTPKRNRITENQQNQTLCSDNKLTDNNQSTLCTEQTNNEGKNSQSSFATSTETQTSATTSSVPTDEIINILLLGETGVGKSTFINAFVNYLTYETLSEAESKQPVVLIPVSFLITTGNNFEEHIVKFGDSDSLNNEDFKHSGQSVTQRCRSYLFHLKHHDGKKLRIIDTPGFGDTRGLAQDDLNMQHILEYINNLTHLNAICFLLKPNESRIHIFFKLCLTQLFDFLGTNVRQKIIFCFTNSRTTFYTPGNTAPLLKTVLKSFSFADTLFQKKNTFCFDSESFRYLVAVKNQISFNDDEKCDYATSWSKSVADFNRLLNYICQDNTLYRMYDDWQSIKHAQLEINQMVRPMVEAMRNILRNIILFNSDPMKGSIEMSPKPIHHPITICLLCKHELNQIANFWILPNCQHNIQDNDHNCSDASNQHIILDYVLDYNIGSDHLTLQKNELLDQVSLLNDASAMFTNFLMHSAVVPRDDPFSTGLTRMFDEEKYICTQKERHILNMQLSEELQILISKYTYRLPEVKLKEKYTELSFIYNLIKIVQNITEVRIQLTAVKKGQEYMMKQYEYEVPK